MTLEPELVRAVLLYLEDHLILYKEDQETRRFQILGVTTTELCSAPELSEFPEYDIVYAVWKLYEGGMITLEKAPERDADFYYLTVLSITWEGHEFLANIKSDTVWNKASEKAKELGNVSIKALAFFAKTIITAYINNPQTLQNLF